MRTAATFSAILLLAVSCSTTKVLAPDEYRLASSRIEVCGKAEGLDASQLATYVKQKPNSSLFGWNPFLSIYNWSACDNAKLSAFWQKLGEAPVVFNPDMIKVSEDNIARHLEYLGWYGSEVSAEVVTRGRLADVTYSVTPGRRYVVDAIEYAVPADSAFAADFARDTLKRSFGPGDFLSEESLSAEAERSTEFLRRYGYYDLRTDNYSFEADTLAGDGHAILTYNIEGPQKQYTIGDVAYYLPADLKFRESVIKGMNLVTPGETYDERNVSNSYSRFMSLKLFNSVNIETSPDTHSGTVDCNVRLGQSTLQGFKLNFEASTNSSGLIGLSPQANFYHKNFLGGGEWLNVGFTGKYQFNPGTDTRAREFGTSMSLSLPRFVGLPYRMFKGSAVPRTEINLAFNYQDRPEFTRNLFSASYGYAGSFAKRYNYQIYPLQFSYVRLLGVEDEFQAILDRNPYLKYSYQDHFDAGVGAALYYTTDASVVPSADLIHWRISADASGNLINLAGAKQIWGAPVARYVKAEAYYAQTIRIGREGSSAIAFRILAGAGCACGDSESLPYEKQFYCGGAGSMRGWQARALGPGYSALDKAFSIPSQTGDVKFEADLEFRFPMFWKLDGALFAEAGNIWTLDDTDPLKHFEFGTMAESLAADWGAGVRLNLGFLLMRVDMGIKLRDPSRTEKWISPTDWFGSDGFAVHFGVGYPF